MKYFVYLLLIATLSVIIWILPNSLAVWTGDADYKNLIFSISFIIPILLWFWVVWVNGRFQIIKHLGGYPIWISTYMVFIVLSPFGPEYLFFDDKLRNNGISEGYNYIFGIIDFISFPFCITGWNLLLSLFERKKPTIKITLLLVTSSVSILLCSLLISTFLEIGVTLNTNKPVNFIDGLHPISWLTNGSLIFTAIMYEGIYYLWLKEKLPSLTLWMKEIHIEIRSS